ncbi:MAG: hypothetical protein J6U54_04020 [Clostridiales bacterium]|nr:hypothetical protein [Clostridiales bacterium]
MEENIISTNPVTIENRIKMVVVGRGKKDDPVGHIANVVWNATKPQEAAHGAKEQFIPADCPLYAKALEVITTELKTHLADGETNTAFDIYAMRQGVVLRYYQIAKAMKAAREAGTELDIESLYQDFMTDKERGIIAEFVDTLQKLLASKNYVRLYDANLINYVELAVPEGVKIPNGTVLKFDNGVATYKDKNGIAYEVSTRDWKNFKRDRATVQVFDEDTEYPVYATKFSSRPSGLNQELLLAKAELFKACPAYVCDRVGQALSA